MKSIRIENYRYRAKHSEKFPNGEDKYKYQFALYLFGIRFPYTSYWSEYTLEDIEKDLKEKIIDSLSKTGKIPDLKL